MHDYLRSIGFSQLNKEDLQKIMYRACKNPDGMEMAVDTEGNELAEIRLEIGDNLGLAMRGSFDEDDEFSIDYYFPYCLGSHESIGSDVQIIKESDRECFQGICEHEGVQMDLIFHLQNMLPVLKQNDQVLDDVRYEKVKFGALALTGTIIMPVYSTKNQKDLQITSAQQRKELIADARQGDMEAYEKLTIEDMDTYASISKRIKVEDLYSIVYSSFMPSGIENDKYAVLGQILSLEEVVNAITKESVYKMTINSNDIIFDVAINKKDLLGIPQVGRRFKGQIWLQGQLNNC